MHSLLLLHLVPDARKDLVFLLNNQIDDDTVLLLVRLIYLLEIDVSFAHYTRGNLPFVVLTRALDDVFGDLGPLKVFLKEEF